MSSRLASLVVLILVAPALAGEARTPSNKPRSTALIFSGSCRTRAGRRRSWSTVTRSQNRAIRLQLQQQNEIAGGCPDLHLRDHENETVPLKLTDVKGRYTLPMPGKDTSKRSRGKSFSAVTGFCQWRVFEGGKNGLYLLSYAASLAPGHSSVKPWDRLALEIRAERADIGTFIQVTWMRAFKPLARTPKSKFWADPLQEKPLKTSSGKEGVFVFENTFRDFRGKPGLYGIRVCHVEAKGRQSSTTVLTRKFTTSRRWCCPCRLSDSLTQLGFQNRHSMLAIASIVRLATVASRLRKTKNSSRRSHLYDRQPKTIIRG